MMIRYVLTLPPPEGMKLKGFSGFPACSLVMDVLEGKDSYLVRVRRSGQQADFAANKTYYRSKGFEVIKYEPRGGGSQRSGPAFQPPEAVSIR